jgi:hypothetical protein
MPILIESKRKKPETIPKTHPGAVILDVTSHASLIAKYLENIWPEETENQPENG